MEIVIVLIITLVVAIYIALPFFLRRKSFLQENNPNVDRADRDPLSERLLVLDNQKEALYSAIRDIDFDYGLGKLSSEDYEELNQKYKNEAASVLKEIDQIKNQSNNTLLDDEIEKEVKAYRSTKSISDTNSISDEDLENEISAFRAKGAPSVCAECGAKYSLDDLFCSKCGAKIKK